LRFFCLCICRHFTINTLKILIPCSLLILVVFNYANNWIINNVSLFSQDPFIGFNHVPSLYMLLFWIVLFFVFIFSNLSKKISNSDILISAYFSHQLMQSYL
jgi:hypothetical protein